LVKVLVNGNLDAGYYTANIDTKELANGVYFYRLTAGRKTFTKKMLVVK